MTAIAALMPAGITVVNADPPQGCQIPVIINIYPGSGTTEEDAREAVNEASKILSQGDFSLVVVEVNDAPEGDDGSGPGTAGDGEFSGGERRKIRQFGGKELADLPNQKGIKIAFGKTPKQGGTTPGISVHKNPTIIVKDRGSAESTGETIAHEIGHVMTLSKDYKIDDNTDSNEHGHAPDKDGDSGNGNIMAPSNRRTGTHLTPDEIAEMQLWQYTHGKCATQFRRAYPALKDKIGFGRAHDDLDDHSSAAAIHDISEVVVYSLDDDDRLHARMTVAGVFPLDESATATYSLAFDIDRSLATGIQFAEMQGVDRIVRIQVTGSTEDEAFEVSGVIDVPSTGGSVPLAETPVVETDPEFSQDPELAEPYATSVLFSIEKRLLGLSTTEVPVIATAGLNEVVDDWATFDFDQARWQDDPTLRTFGDGIPVPGDPYRVSVEGLAANSPFDFYVGGALVMSDTLDEFGSFQGAITFPAGASSSIPQSLTAQDNTGEFAYNITCPDPESTILFEGRPEGGTVQFDLEDESIVVATGPGDSIIDVAERAQRTISANATLRHRGIRAWTFGNMLATNGRVTALTLDDAGLEAPAERPNRSVIWTLLIVGALALFALLFILRRR